MRPRSMAAERVRPPFRLIIPLALGLLPIGAGVIYGLSTAILVLAALVLGAVVLLLWSSVQSLTGEAPMTLDDALSLAAPSAEEERKRALLRALKDLEYERSVGKVSEEDFQTLSAQYRSEAKELLRVIDAARESGQEHVDRLLKKRLEGPARKKAKPKRKAEEQALPETAPADDPLAEEP
jgi:hypothetical protein